MAVTPSSDSLHQSVSGVRITTFNKIMTVVACVIYALLLYTTLQVNSRYQTFSESTTDYIACEKDAQQLSQASDFLTEQVRLYTQYMDVSHVKLYFDEVDHIKRREQAIEDLKTRHPTPDLLQSLESAAACSESLQDREILAMKLISVANGYDLAKLPEVVRNTEIPAAYRNLPSTEMIEQARSLVFDRGYSDAKALIQLHINHFTKGILDRITNRQMTSNLELRQSLFEQQIMITLLFILSLVTFAAIIMLIVKPLTIYMKCIQEKLQLELSGSYEFRYFALTYNQIYEANAANEAMLLHRATHDPLTGVMNRSAMDHVGKVLRLSPMPFALIIFDIDHFKAINDTFGHEIGDRILKKLGRLLSSSFRSRDYPIRIGGDEFVVILTDFPNDRRDVIRRKISRINEAMQDTTDGLPAVSLSMGVSLSPEGFTDDLYAKADRALYNVKDHGRNGIAFEDEIP